MNVKVSAVNSSERIRGEAEVDSEDGRSDEASVAENMVLGQTKMILKKNAKKRRKSTEVQRGRRRRSSLPRLASLPELKSGGAG